MRGWGNYLHFTGSRQNKIMPEIKKERKCFRLFSDGLIKLGAFEQNA